VFFPLRDDNPTLTASIVTLALIGANVACWLLLQGFGFDARALAISVCEHGAIPGELLGRVAPGTAVPMGDDLTCVIEAQARWSTVLTSMFMHAGWLHLIGNMWFLWVFGDNVEDAMGHARFLAFYLACGLAAFAAQAASDPASAVPMVGASGAIGGVLGAYARLYPRARVHMLAVWLVFVQRMVVPAVIVLGLWFLLQIVSGLPTLGATGTGGVAFWAHAGGFLAGVVAIPFFISRDRVQTHRDRHRDEVHTRDDGPFGL
jgi:membrane associated rhomboid family serine protease